MDCAGLLPDGLPAHGGAADRVQGDAADLPPQVLQDFLDAGTAAVPIGRVYQFDQIVAAHADMEQDRAGGDLVVTT